MTMPTAPEILCLYLYGQKTPPADLKSDTLIRSTGPGQVPAIVDMNEYMTTGGGRFVKVENFNYVRNFLASNDTAYKVPTLQAGTYTRNDLLAAYKLPVTSYVGIQQYFLGLGDADYIDRAYVFGSGEFEINSDAKFIVNTDGSREILDIAVVPVNDNFDFESTSVPAQVTNWLTKDRIDPSGIGRQVPIIFKGTIANKQDLTGEDWYALTLSNSLSEVGKWLDAGASPPAVLDFAALMVQFAASGIVDYKDAEGRFVYYDGVSPTHNGTLNATDGLAKVQYRGTLYDGAVALIGGGGNDRLSGADKSDYLLGGAGNDILDGASGTDELIGGDGNDTLDGGADKDQLFGGRGVDTYIVDSQDTITDGDGKGEVRLNGRVLKGGKRKCKDPKNTYRGDKGEIYVLIGTTLMVDGGLIIKNYKKGDLGIQLKDEEDNPIQRIKKKTKCAEDIPSPIMLDLDGDGVGTAELEGGAYFDHAADGFAEMTAWVGSGDGLLVRDINGNGSIDSGRELFGSETQLVNGSKAANGFEALRELDTNSDGVIDANDAAFAELRVWKDSDGNGRTDTGELFTFEDVGVRSINVAFSDSSLVDEQGNEHRQVGSYTTTDGQTRAATDVWVQTNTLYRVPTESVAVPTDVGALPDVQGYGQVRDLRQAMAMDATGELKAMVTAFTQAATPEDRDALVTQIIYRWAGVQDVNPTSRASRMIYGNAIGDARKLEALEEFMGEEWVGVWCWGTRDPNPHGRAAPVLLAAWDELKALVYGQIMTQTHLSDLIQSIIYRLDPETEAVIGDLSVVAQTLTTRIESDRDAGLQDLGDFLYSLKGMGLLDRLDVASFKAGLLPLGVDVAQVMETALTGWVDPLGPTEGDDVLRGTEFNDVIDALGGNDHLLGRGGNDTLIGGKGDDLLDGGAGNDEMRGGSHSDTYHFGRGFGADTVVEDSWNFDETDRIELKAGVLPSDVRLERVRSVNGWQVSDDLKITIRDTGETITVRNHFNDSNRFAVEEIAFANGTLWDAETIKSLSLLGEAGNDELRGFDGRDDLLVGGAGNDVLEGRSGADTYRFGLGDGQDVIHEL